MPRKGKVPSARPATGLRWLFQFALPLVLGLSLLSGVAVLGRLALRSLQQRGSVIAFAAIDCDPPEGTAKDQFLEEVQYLANLPDQLDLYDDGLTVRLASAFGQHPWVAEVERVEKGPGRLVVRLRYRVPVLAVRLPNGRDGGGLLRSVDEEAVLLPASAEVSSLPVLTGVLSAGPARPGKPCVDPRVSAAAQVAGVLCRHRPGLPFEKCEIEVRDEVVLRGRGWRVVWGKPPGLERAEEPDAEEKVRRLAEGGVDGRAIDLRRREQAGPAVPSTP
jgi:hypothetical protein